LKLLQKYFFIIFQELNSIRHNAENVKKKRIAFLETRLQEFCDDIRNFSLDKNINNKMKDLDINGVFNSNVLINNINKNKAIEIKDKYNMYNIHDAKLNDTSVVQFLGFDEDERNESIVDLKGDKQKQEKNVKPF
jgi:hypothetical protein